MKKNLFKTRLLSFTALCGLTLAFASCANDDTVQNPAGKDTDNDKNLTTFVAAKPAETRTSMDYTTGSFYWESGDKIWVKDDDGTWQQSSNAPTGKIASFKYKVPGKFTKGNTYKVYYPGKNGSNNQVSIPATQTQTVPNTTDHFGVSVTVEQPALHGQTQRMVLPSRLIIRLLTLFSSLTRATLF